MHADFVGLIRAPEPGIGDDTVRNEPFVSGVLVFGGVVFSSLRDVDLHCLRYFRVEVCVHLWSKREKHVAFSNMRSHILRIQRRLVE